MADIDSINRDFTKYDQVAKVHTYRLAEHPSDEFDEDYEIATLDFEPFLRGDASDKARFAKAFVAALRGDWLRRSGRPRRRSCTL